MKAPMVACSLALQPVDLIYYMQIYTCACARAFVAVVHGTGVIWDGRRVSRQTEALAAAKDHEKRICRAIGRAVGENLHDATRHTRRR